MKESGKPSTQHWMTLLLLSLIWGSSFILIKKGLLSFSAVQVGSLRIGIAFLILLPYSIKVFRRIPTDKFKFILALGLVGSFIPAFLFAIAQTKIASATAGMLNSIVPLATYLWGISLFRQARSKKRLLGIGLGLLGATALIYEPQAQIGLNYYALLILLASVLYGLGSNIAHSFLDDVNATDITALSFTMLGIPALAILLSSNFIEVMQTDPRAWKSLGYIAILSLAGTAFALVLFWKLIKETDAVFGSLTTYLIPIVAIFWGLLDGEELSIQKFLGFALIMLSVFLVKSKVDPQSTKNSDV